MKKVLKQLLYRCGYELRRIPKRDKIKNSGDLKKIFSYIYKSNVWGGEKGNFYSGPGSDEKVTKEYVSIVNTFIKNNNIKSVVDVGCGDFRVGALIWKQGITYTGIDIVPELISNNQKKFGSFNVGFKCLNAVTDELPDGEVCLIRQVLQHLSNQHIQTILHKCRKFRYVIVSEHIPKGLDVIPNLDMSASWDIRAIKNSGVFIEEPPYNIQTKTLLEVDPSHEGYSNSVIRTSLITNY